MAKQIQIIPKNIVYPVARVLNKEDRELYEEVDRKTAEKFGKDSLAYKTITNGIDVKNVTGSQFFWNLNLNSYLPKNQKVISLEDMEAINDLDEEFFKGFYTDTPQIILRTEVSFCDKNKYILENLVKQIKRTMYEFSSKNPLIISNLKLVKDENSKNEYGLFLRIGDDTKIINDKRFALLNNQKQIPFGEKQKTIYTREDGLSRLYLDRNSYLDSDNDNLADSNDNGRVVLKDTEGVAPKKLGTNKYLEEYNKAKKAYFNLLNEIKDKINDELRR